MKYLTSSVLNESSRHHFKCNIQSSDFLNNTINICLIRDQVEDQPDTAVTSSPTTPPVYTIPNPTYGQVEGGPPFAPPPPSYSQSSSVYSNYAPVSPLPISPPPTVPVEDQTSWGQGFATDQERLAALEFGSSV